MSVSNGDVNGFNHLERVDSVSSTGSVYGSVDPSISSESRVLVLYTGGTIGMKPNASGKYAVCKGYIQEILRALPMLHDEEYAVRIGIEEEQDMFVLPKSKQGKRIIYKVMEYDVLKDSSNIDMEDWIQMAEDIRTHYQQFDGFVLFHGTDTMAYTASALSFMMENLGKPVILTGAQVPLAEMWSDGRDNVMGAVFLAGHYSIPEVSLYFDHKLFRGNRAVKMSCENFDAFESPNLPPLASISVNINISWESIFRPTALSKFDVHTNLNRNVGLLRLFPCITKAMVHAFLQPPIEGVVLQTYGSGNCPSARKDLVNELFEAARRGVLIVNCTQCNKGSVIDSYETGQALADAGVVQGADMTPEAALCKLSYVLSMDNLSIEEKRQLMQMNLRGELSVLKEEQKSALHHNKVIRAVADSLKVTSEMDLKMVGEALFPPMILMAARKGDISMLKHLKECGGDLSSADYDGRTALHLVACEGHYEAAKYLLENGSSLYLTDRYGHTPFLESILHMHFDIITLMRETGAHFVVEGMTDLATHLCSSAASGNVAKLKAFHVAGVDLNVADYSGNTALHVSVLNNQRECIKFLLEAGADINKLNASGQTALGLARQWCHSDAVEVIEKQLAESKI